MNVWVFVGRSVFVGVEVGVGVDVDVGVGVIVGKASRVAVNPIGVWVAS